MKYNSAEHFLRTLMSLLDFFWLANIVYLCSHSSAYVLNVAKWYISKYDEVFL